MTYWEKVCVMRWCEWDVGCGGVVVRISEVLGSVYFVFVVFRKNDS